MHLRQNGGTMGHAGESRGSSMTVQERALGDTAIGEERAESPWALGLIVVAAIFLVVGGAFHVIQGLAAILDDQFFAAVENYAFDLNVQTWGWIHVVTGIILAAAGFALFSGALWARIVAVFVAVASAIVSFLYIPYFPVWSIVTLSVDGAIIWAVTAHGGDLADA
jgi:hypothetical protein